MPNMAKWFFMVFIALLALVMNVAMAGPRREFIVLVYGLVAVNVFALALLLIWLASYYSSFGDRGFGVIGHALVFLAVGLGFVGVGHFGLVQSKCVFPDSQLSTWASERGACSVLSLFSIVLGILIAWPSLNLLYGITSRSNRSGGKIRPPVNGAT